MEADGQDFEVSPQQRHLWRLGDELEASPFRVQAAWRLAGPLNRDRLSGALRSLVARYEILRTTFVRVPGLVLPLQRVSEEAAVAGVRECDLRHLSGAEQDRELERLLREARAVPLDFARSSLLDLVLVTLADTDHVLLLTLPALCADGESLRHLRRDIAREYAQEGAPREDEPLQYPEIAAWQNDMLTAEAASAGKVHWHKQDLSLLGRNSSPLPAAADAPPAFHPESVSAALDGETLAGLAALAPDLPLDLCLLTGWQILLHRLSGAPALVVGVGHAGRSYAELAAAVGPLARYLPVRAEILPAWSFREAVRHVKEAWRRNRGLEESFSWDDHREAAAMGSGEPFFPLCFDYSADTMAEEEWGGEGLRCSTHALHACIDRFRLSLSCRGDYRGVILDLQLDAVRFGRWQALQLLDRYQTLLAGAASDPDAAVTLLPLTGPIESHRLLCELNDTAAAWREEARLELLFEARAESSPKAIAVICEGVEMSYGVLDARANQLAQHLRSLGIGPEMRVAICLERSLHMLTGLLGILKAGAAYVPLDPDYPLARLQLMLRDAGASVLLTQASLAGRLAPHAAREVLIDSDWQEIGRHPAVAPGGRVSVDSAAYVIYTSGSTGQPKGVVVSHRAIANRLQWMRHHLPLDTSDRLLQKTPISFDASIWEIFLPLWSGALLVLARPGGHADPSYLVRLVREQGITVLQLVPSMLEAFLREPEAAACGSLRRLFCGGEALSAELRRKSTATLDAALCNLYGPTEAAIDATFWPCTAEEPRVPIGRPLANVTVHLLGRSLQLVASGLEGEIFIGGAGLARGYQNRPDLTAERFLPDPWSGVPGARLYRTGDLGRRLPGGEIDYLGRADQQVKLRGYRIELGEIEQALLQFPGVCQAVVEIREEGDRKRLVAYVVPQGAAEDGPAADALRGFLAERLPDYMVPVSYVTLERLPLLPSGKLDRRSLPVPKAFEDAGTADEAPRNSVESRLVAIWSEILNRPQVGIHDNFFELGGDSILILQVVARARRQGIHLTPRQLFQQQTIATLAAVAGTTGNTAEEQGTVTGEVSLTPIQRLFFERDLADPHHFNQSLLLAVTEPLDPPRLEMLVDALARHHDALRLRFERGPESWRQVVAPPSAGAVGCTWLDLAALPPEARRGAIEQACGQAQANLDLSRGPLARAVCCDLGAGEPCRLLLVIHHLAIDGVSWRILLEDLQAGHEQLRRGEPLQFPPKTTSFQRWAERLTAHAGSAAVHAELADWLSALDGPVEPLPVDFPAGREAATGATLETHDETLTSEETRSLLEEVPRVYHTEINDVLLAALAAAFGQCGVARVLVDLEGHGREPLFDDVDLVRTVGWFTTVFPVRLDLSGAHGPGEELQLVKERLRAVPNRGIGYGLLRYLSDPEVGHRLRELPRPEVSFNYLGRFDQVLPEASPYRLAAEASGAERSPRQAARHFLDVTGFVAGGRLRMRWTYSREVFRPPTIERLARAFGSAMRRLIEHCRSPYAGAATAADFPLARIDQATLDRLAGGSPSIEDIYPLSPLQQGLLAHALRRPGGKDAYFRQLSLEVEGEIDVQAFSRAWQKVMERHPILRTRFHWEGLEAPLQVVERDAVLPFRLDDWRALPPAEQQARWMTLLAAEQERGFDLAEAPLMRLALIRRGERQSYFAWSYHHLLLDGWSVPLLWQELETCYASYRAGTEPRLPAARPYREYIAWLDRQDMAAAESFWRSYLAGFTDPTPLPGDRLPGERRTPARDEGENEGEIHLIVPAATVDLLQSVGRRHHITLNTLIQGAWALLLAHGSGEDDVSFGIVSSGRPAALSGIETMMGLFVNTLPLRVRVRAEAPLADWLQELQANQAEVRELEYSPLAQVRRWSDVTSGKSLFESILAFENYPVARAEGERNAEERWRLHGVLWQERTEYPLTLIAAPGPHLVLKILYDPERFTAAAVERLKLQLEALIAGCAAAPERAIAELSPLGEAQRHQLCLEWNDTGYRTDQESSLVRLFERQADLAPDSLAVVCGEERLSYRELERQANQLGHLLLTAGLRHGELVAIHLSRSPQAIVSLLAIHKAGGAYVPLDRNFPPARLQWILKSTGIHYLITQTERLEPLREVLDDLPALQHVVCFGAEPVGTAPEVPREANWELWPEGRMRGMSRERPKSATGTDDLAYIIFTSGSTGTPKGVMVRHRPVINLIDWVNREHRITASDRVLFTSSLSFDLSVYDIFGLLAAGGTIHVAREADLRDPERLVALLTGEPVTFWDSAPALLQQLVPYLPTVPQSRGRLRLVFLSGDWIPVKLPDAVRSAFPQAQVVSLGGATEATVWSNFYPIGTVEARWASIPYGRPIQNARYYVLDRRLAPCPLGVAGDLYIGGSCLAAGYAGDPVLSAAKFIPDPFSQEPGDRLYRTGDRARFWPDGILEFLGRVDHQVKLRGFRIELGEIEAQLHGHPAVQAAVVMVREDQPGVRRLVAYLVPRRETQPPGAAELRDLLAARLPDYMVPAAFVTMATLPVTANGKLDRRALPPPEWERPALQSAYVAPRNPTEGLLAEIWSALLGIEQVGVHDHFLELGGDSILALQVVSRAHRAGLRITPAMLYEHPTIAELAPLANTEAGVTAEQGQVTGDVPLTPVQQWFFAAEPVDPHHFNQALMLRSGRRLSPVHFAAAVGAMLAHHDALRLRFRRELGRWRQSTALSGGEAPVISVDLSGLPSAAARQAIESAAEALQGSLDLSHGPLLRAALFDLGPGQPTRLLLVIHHLAIDGVSWRILLEDLATAYEDLVRGAGVTLPPKTTSFKQWAERLVTAAGAPEIQEQAAYWLSPAQASAARLPVDFPAGRNTVSSVRHVQMSLPAAETRALLREVPAVYNTEIQDLLLAALAQAFAAWTGARSLRVDLESHGRDTFVAEGLDLSRTVGWLTVISPLLLDLSEAEQPGAVIRSVKEQLRSVPGRGLAYGLLRFLGDEGALGDRLRALPDAEVIFNYLGRIDQALPATSPFSAAEESAGWSSSPRQTRRWLLQIEGAVVEEKLRLTLSYSASLHRAATIQSLASGFVGALSALIRHCQSPDAGGFTPSDLPLARLDRAEVSLLEASLAAATGLPAPQAARQVEDLYPLSPLQESMLSHAVTLPESQVNREQWAVEIRGALDVSAFERAWLQAIERHSSLRTAFLFDGLERPLQAVYRRGRLPLQTHDWHGAAGESTERMRALLSADREEGFDLTAAPLMRLHLCRTGEESWLFVWSHHHLILDGWSRSLVLNEVLTLYNGLRLGKPAELPAARPFRSYIAWLDRQDPAAAEAFWRRSFSGCAGPTPLVLDRPTERDREGSSSACSRRAELSMADTAELESFARRHQLTLSTVVQAAWALLLARYSGLDEAVSGATVSGRPADLPDAEAIVGMLINNLPVRLPVPAAALAGPWLVEAQRLLQELRRYEHNAPAQIQEWSGLPWGQRLFETLVVFQNYPAAGRRTPDPGLEVRSGFTTLETGYALTLVANPGPRLGLEVSYQRRRFAASSVARMLDHLMVLLCGLAAGPERRLGDLPLLTQTEIQQTMADSSSEAQPVLRISLVRRFAEQALDAPEAVAIEDHEVSWTYGELADHVRRTACRLRDLGVAPGDPVALLTGSARHRAAGALGTLAAGGICLPLDEAWAAERLAATLASARPAALLVEDGLDAPAGFHAPMLRLGAAGVNDEPQPSAGAAWLSALPGAAGPAWLVSPEDRPDALVSVSHGALDVQLRALGQRLGLGAEEIFLATSLGWDAALLELLLPLSLGARLAVAPPVAAVEGAALNAALHASGATVLPATPIQLQRLLRSGWRGDPVLRILCHSGPLARGLAERLGERCGSLWSLYGGAAPGLWLAAHRVSGTGDLQSGDLLGGGRLHALDPCLQPVPVGVVGELFAEVDGHPAGYLCQPQLTAECFLPSPWVRSGAEGSGGARLLRTGERCRRLANGSLELLGRRRERVPVGGYSIELGEVEAVLRRHPEVCGAVVTAGSHAGVDPAVALITLAPESGIEPAEIRRFLQEEFAERLPPCSLLIVDSLPATVDGKLDRTAAVWLGVEGLRPGAELVPPRDSLELELVHLWEELFARRPLGVRDNFFELGGHSVLAVRLMARLRERFGADLPLATLFAEGNVENLARVLRGRWENLPWSPLVTIQPGGSARPLFCIHPAAGSVLRYRNLAAGLGSDRPVYALQPQGERRDQRPLTRIEDIAASYLAAVRQVQPEGPYLLAGWSFGGYVGFEMAQRLTKAGEQVELLAMLDTGIWPRGQEPDARQHLLAYVEHHLPESLVGLPQQAGIDEQIRYLTGEMKRLGRLTPDVEAEDVQRYFNLYMTNVRAAHHYTPSRYSGRVTVFRAVDSEPRHPDPFYGWSEVALGGVEVHAVPGNHSNLLSPPRVAVLAESLRGCLSRLRDLPAMSMRPVDGGPRHLAELEGGA